MTSERREMKTSEFVENGVKAILEALDEYVRTVTRHPDASGWSDADISNIVPPMEAHLRSLADRLCDPNSNIPGSHNVMLTNDGR